MPLNAVGWSNGEDEKLVELVQPHPYLYNLLDPSRKNILARESTWQEIAKAINKPVEECKKRWRGLRDGYMRSKRMGTMHKTRVNMFEKLQFLDGTSLETSEEILDEITLDDEVQQVQEEVVGTEQQVITDNQEYYEITVVDGPPENDIKPFIKLVPKPINLKSNLGEPPKKIARKNAGRKKSMPMPTNIPPIKILPKPLLMNEPRIVRYIEDPKKTEKSQVIDKLIEKVLKENTNEIDVFFRSMAASVKKLQPNLIPKVKMEVCNVIAKYEMQNYDNLLKNVQNL